MALYVDCAFLNNIMNMIETIPTSGTEEAPLSNSRVIGN